MYHPTSAPYGIPSKRLRKRLVQMEMSGVFSCKSNSLTFEWFSTMVLNQRQTATRKWPVSYLTICININTEVIIQNRVLSLTRYLGLSADNHLDGQNGCQYSRFATVSEDDFALKRFFMSCLDRQLRDSFFMYFPFCWKTCIHTVNIFSKFSTSENANLKNYVFFLC